MNMAYNCLNMFKNELTQTKSDGKTLIGNQTNINKT